MINEALRILLLEDAPADAELIEYELRKNFKGSISRRVWTQDQFLLELYEFGPHLILSDYMLPGWNGMQALLLTQKRTPLTPLIIVTGSLNEEIAVDCMKAGAADYVLKDHLVRLAPSIRSAIDKKWAQEEKKRAEDHLRTTVVELAQTNKELEDILFAASHDLQEPLRKIANYVELIVHRYHERLDDDGRKFAAYIERSVDQMQKQLRDIVRYADARNKHQAIEPTALQDVIERVQEELSDRIQYLGATVVVQKLPVVSADPLEMRHVLKNLIDNALKFRGPKPPLIEISSDQKDGEWVIAIRDNGIGIDAQEAGHLFAVFKRLNSQTDYPGSGMGLAVCKKILEHYGGRIWFSSDPGQGTTFYFSLPAKDLPASTNAPMQAERATKPSAASGGR